MSEYKRLKDQASSLGISIAEVIRRAIRDALSYDNSRPWMRFAGFVESGDPKSSQSVDNTVYRTRDCH